MAGSAVNGTGATAVGGSGVFGKGALSHSPRFRSPPCCLRSSCSNWIRRSGKMPGNWHTDRISSATIAGAGKRTLTSEDSVLPRVFERYHWRVNVSNQPLSEMLDRGIRDLWCLNKNRVETCKVCQYLYFCHDCRSWVYGYSGNLTPRPPMCTCDTCTGEWGPADEALQIDESL